MQDVLVFVDECIDWYEEYKIKVSVPKDVAMWQKWISRSALQKAIRRGQTERALSVAARLWKIEADYCWRSLAVIAVEDIGFGCPEAVLFSHLAQLKTFRGKLNEGALLTALVGQMCENMKSRSCCELSIGMDMSGPMNGFMKQQAEWSNSKLLEKVIDPDIGACYGAMRIARGNVPEGGLPRKKNDDLIGLIEETIKHDLPEPWASAAIHAYRRPVDTMSIAMFPTSRLFLQTNETQACEIVEDVFPESVEINGFQSEAYDMHEQTGKKAIKAFHTSLSKSYPVIAEIPKMKAGKALGSAIFVEEGGLVDQRIMGGDLWELQTVQDTVFLHAYGVPDDHYDEIRKIVRNEIPRLNQKRAWAAGLES
jgi:hypothetical protein